MLKQDLRWWLPLTILAVISSTGLYQWYLSHSQQSKFAGDYVDTIAEQLSLKRFDEQGRLSQSLASPLAEHYALSKSTHFKNPSVLVYPTEANRAVWQMNAGLGVLSGRKDRLDLSAGVEARELISNGKRLVTSQMTWYPQQKIAITEQALTGTEPGIRVTAVGAQFEQATGVIHLFNQVNAQYQP